jgi:lipoprotein-anchoring transpeptidase ErfK/SrfK
VVRGGESLQDVAREYQVSWQYLARINGVDPRSVPEGTALKVIQGPFHAKAELGRFQLTVHSFGYVVATFPIGVGREHGLGSGKFLVTEKLNDPTYYGVNELIEHDDPRNPLGEFWLELNNEAGSLQGLGIHGSIDPESIGREVAQGSIRLRESDAAQVFDLLTVGSEVEIVE